ncbi:NAD operon protein [Halorhabdus tiamatea SARL4B]|uniref:NAD operon protein n=1 Tax=Halorhabdus tiamatea SARL4B TaxID=1033806 RepID=F7PPA4_9EURY|nr:SAM-dependent chlorinase/fluorinase [Halorhabdus tiamatea]ERJ07103.1 NAD operon protein [Halorhabdus tiamatea SARL4B]CCQ32722.1 S-adenosyl-l-methionine hydroxide adenosyltransferase [Halorhabdus tiamatea SARL4B]
MITLSSDFGAPYPAAMKGVLTTRTDARLIDVSHDFPRQDVQAAAFWLREILPSFPPAVHLVVVDPGVGTDRAALAVRAGEHVLVGPDNGVLIPAARELADGADEPAEADGIEVFEYRYDDPESVTFHGRDVFAPMAATVHEAGLGAFESGDRFGCVEACEDLAFPEPTTRDDGVDGEVLVVDDFGNAITNVPGEVLTDRFGEAVTVNGVWAPARRTYATVEADNRLVTVGSHGNVELAVNRGRGEERFSVSPGSRVRLRWT